MNPSTYFLVLFSVLLPVLAPAANGEEDLPAAIGSRERLSLDEGWRFHLGDIPFPEIKGHDASYSAAKAGNAVGAAAPSFDDSAWKVLDLPHDWAVEGPFDKEENLSQGYRPRGIAWYRRAFKLPETDRGRHLEIQIDGVATHCTVWLNGTVVHRNWCGYTSFTIDATPLARFGDDLNTLVVRVDADAQEGWWYEGAGIYRHTWLVKRNPFHIVTDGVFAQPFREGDKTTWTIPIEATLHNSGKAPANALVVSELVDAEGQSIARTETKAAADPLETETVTMKMRVENPKLWSPDEPNLYSIRTTVIQDGRELDSVTTPAGFRTFAFTANDGFILNDKPLRLHGTCNHQDHAGVGVAVPASIWDFRIRRLKEMGVNAYRSAHNPPAAEFLEACDRLGMLVLNENRHFNSSPEYIRQLEWLVRRDRNHPSVILWSVFNEEPQQGTRVGYEMVRRMAHVVRKLDPTRPVTAAMSAGLFEPVNVAQAVDVVGLNYQSKAYDEARRAYPEKALTSSEDTSGFMTRGVYETDHSRNLIGSYDTEHAPWGDTHRESWRRIVERPFLAGTFIWTGFDYRGEPSPLAWPSVSSFFGAMDVCGFPKAAYYIRQAQFLPNQPILHLIPHWNWPGKEGQEIKVMAISNADEVELFLNGASLGKKTSNVFEFAEWQVPYTPGRLEVVGHKSGREVSRYVVETTGDPVRLRLTPDRAVIAGDGRDAVPVTVEALDGQGRPVPTANLPVTFSLSGPGKIIGHGNGDPNSHEPEKGNRRSLFNGLAQVIIQSDKESGEIVLGATASGLEPAEIRLQTKAVEQIPAVPPQKPVLALNKWRQSPASEERPDPNQSIPENDQNSWPFFSPAFNTIRPLSGGNYTIFRTSFEPFARQRQEGGKIFIAQLTGKAEVWIDGKMAGRKTTFEPEDFVVDLPRGDGLRTLSVLIEAAPGQPAGPGGLIFVE